eukprot:6967745-Lingulodinium_polyedra.AAC.1
MQRAFQRSSGRPRARRGPRWPFSIFAAGLRRSGASGSFDARVGRGVARVAVFWPRAQVGLRS